MAVIDEDLPAILVPLAKNANGTDSPASRRLALRLLNAGTGPRAADVLRAASALVGHLDAFASLPIGVVDRKAPQGTLSPFNMPRAPTVPALRDAWRSVPPETLPRGWTMTEVINASNGAGRRIYVELRTKGGDGLGRMEIFDSAIRLERGNVHATWRAPGASEAKAATTRLMDLLASSPSDDDGPDAARLAVSIVAHGAFRTIAGSMRRIVDDAVRGPVDARIASTLHAVALVHAIACAVRPEASSLACADPEAGTVVLAFGFGDGRGIFSARPDLPDRLRAMVAGPMAVAAATEHTGDGYVEIDLRSDFAFDSSRMEPDPMGMAALVREYGTDGSEIAAAMDGALDAALNAAGRTP